MDIKVNDSPEFHDKGIQYSLVGDVGKYKVAKQEIDQAAIISELQVKLDSLNDTIARENVARKSEAVKLSCMNIAVETLLSEKFHHLNQLDQLKRDFRALESILKKSNIRHSGLLDQFMSSFLNATLAPLFREWRNQARESRFLKYMDRLKTVAAEQEAVICHHVNQTRVLKSELNSKCMHILNLNNKLRSAARARLSALVGAPAAARLAFSAWRGVRYRNRAVLTFCSTAAIDLPSGAAIQMIDQANTLTSEARRDCLALSLEVDRLKREKLETHLAWLAGDHFKILHAEIQRLKCACNSF